MRFRKEAHANLCFACDSILRLGSLERTACFREHYSWYGLHPTTTTLGAIHWACCGREEDGALLWRRSDAWQQKIVFFSRLSIIIRANATPYFFDCSVVRIYAFLHPTPKSFEVYSMTFDTFGKFVDQFIGCKFPSNAHIISHRADLKMTSNILRVTPSSLKRQTSADQASS